MIVGGVWNASGSRILLRHPFCSCRRQSFIMNAGRPRVLNCVRICRKISTSVQQQSDQFELPSESGVKYNGLVETEVSRIRLDLWLTSRLPRVSRVRVQSSISLGLILVNGHPASKVSQTVKAGDHILCRLVAPLPMTAEPENILLNVVYEDEHLLVIDKPAQMVVHPAPGHSRGTLVNALLHHCGLPAVHKERGFHKGLFSGQDEQRSIDDTENFLEGDEVVMGPAESLLWYGPAPVIRPGIVHRLDKGTSGLLVVAKDDYTHEHLCNQFKARSVQRSYLSLTCGVPPLHTNRVDVAIGRDPRDRKRMAVVSSPNSRSRSAASR